MPHDPPHECVFSMKKDISLHSHNQEKPESSDPSHAWPLFQEALLQEESSSGPRVALLVPPLRLCRGGTAPESRLAVVALTFLWIPGPFCRMSRHWVCLASLTSFRCRVLGRPVREVTPCPSPHGRQHQVSGHRSSEWRSSL